LANLGAGRAGLSYASFPRSPVDLVFQDFEVVSGGALPRRRGVNVAGAPSAFSGARPWQL